LVLVYSHGRLDKTPGAIALRLRWYGPGDPKLVFVERKTHNDKWTGEVSVKERFTVDASEVPLLLNGKYPIAQKKKEMQDKGATPKEVEEWETLVRECQQVIVSKQLVSSTMVLVQGVCIGRDIDFIILYACFLTLIS
jgi:SPX domain protein involved in polyphosphate accumulation